MLKLLIVASKRHSVVWDVIISGLCCNFFFFWPLLKLLAHCIIHFEVIVKVAFL